jgi:hypothetical protein
MNVEGDRARRRNAPRELHEFPELMYLQAERASVCPDRAERAALATIIVSLLVIASVVIWATS